MQHCGLLHENQNKLSRGVYPRTGVLSQVQAGVLHENQNPFKKVHFQYIDLLVCDVWKTKINKIKTH